MDDDAIETLSGETPPNIPHEIIEEILVKLPARSLLKFRCVSKSWLSLISSPKFIKSHLTYSTLDPALSNYRLVLGVSYDQIHHELKHDSVSSIVVPYLFTDVVKNADGPNEHSEWKFQINGSCNGLLCVSFYWDDVSISRRKKHTFLWNPCLRMSKKLPPSVTAQDAHTISVSLHGIGYDEPNDDYKVAGLFWYLCRLSCVMKLAVEIYSLKNDSWKRIDGFKGAFTKSSPVIFAYGKFSFLETFSFCNYSSDERRIVSLDIANESYRAIAPPEHIAHRQTLLRIHCNFKRLH